MVRIRKLSYFDLPKVKKMISYLGNSDDDRLLKSILDEPVGFLNDILPLSCNFKPQSYLLADEQDILGIITIEPTNGNPYKINITKLIFKQDFYNVGRQLIDFVIAKYGAKGAHSFTVYVDKCHEELCDLFLNGCGFRQCSYENLWKLDNYVPKTNSRANFRYCQNDDAHEVADLYNGELNTIYKPSMERIPKEYVEPIFSGFNSAYKNRYALEDERNKVAAYMSITTSDNLNFIIDICTNTGYQFNYDEIINFALYEISRRKTNFTAFLKHRQYTKNADTLEEYLHSRNLNCIQTQCVFVKDFYRPITETENVLKVFSFNDNGIFTN